MNEQQAGGDEFRVRVINPPHFLRNKTAMVPGSLDEMLARADKLVAGLYSEFEAETELRVRRLPEIFRAQWQARPTRDAACREFRDICHVLKGEAGSFGYELVGEISDLFRDYLKETPSKLQRPEAVKSYVDTFQLVWGQRIRGDGGAAGRQLIASLIKLNEKAGATEN